MNIKAKPVKVYKTPSYPNMKKASLNPELLEKLPERWRHNKAVIAAIIALSSLSLAACNETVKNSNNINAAEAASESTSRNTSEPIYAKVAPIFEHGRGTGSLGCDMVVPPVFMSEQEAMAIIKNEALKAGVNLDDVPDNYTVEAHANLGKAVGLEAADAEKGIAVSFISLEESKVNTDKVVSTASGPLITTSSVSTYNMLNRAKDAVKDWENKDIPYKVGTFYEPGVEYEKEKEIYERVQSDSSLKSEEAYHKYISEVKKVSEEDLRAQVRDFIEWLRGQGII